MSIFQRAFSGLNLTPAERAHIKALQQLGYALGAVILTAGLANLPQIQQYADNQQWGQAAQFALFIVLTAALAWAHKYLAAQKDSPLIETAGMALSALDTRVQKSEAQAGLPAPKVPATDPATISTQDTQALPVLPPSASAATLPAQPVPSSTAPVPVATATPTATPSA